MKGFSISFLTHWRSLGWEISALIYLQESSSRLWGCHQKQCFTFVPWNKKKKDIISIWRESYLSSCHLRYLSQVYIFLLWFLRRKKWFNSSSSLRWGVFNLRVSHPNLQAWSCLKTYSHITWREELVKSIRYTLPGRILSAVYQCRHKSSILQYSTFLGRKSTLLQRNSENVCWPSLV